MKVEFNDEEVEEVIPVKVLGKENGKIGYVYVKRAYIGKKARLVILR